MERAKKRKLGRWVFFFPFWLLIVAMTAGFVVSQSSLYSKYQLELSRAQAELRQEQDNYVELQDQAAYYESDVYIEQLARDILGYVRPNEIVFYNDAD